MSRKDYKQGAADAMNAYEAFARKQEEATRHVGDQISRLSDDVAEMGKSVEFISDYITDKEKQTLYQANMPVDIAELDENDQYLLVAVLYELAQQEPPTEEQQNYIRAIQKYLKVRDVQGNIDLTVVEKIPEIATIIAMMQAIMEYFYLGTHPGTYTEDEIDFLDSFMANRKTRKEITTRINAIVNAVGKKGLAEKYGFVPESDEKQLDLEGDVYKAQENIADIVGVTDGRKYKIVNTDFVETNNYILYPTDESNEPLVILDKRTGKSEVYAMGNGFFATTCSYGDEVLFRQDDTNDCCVLNLCTKQVRVLCIKDESSFAELSMMTERCFVYANSDSDLCIVDTTTQESWPMKGVFNDRIRWLCSNPIVSDKIIYYFEQVDEKECSYLCAYDLLNRKAEPVCLQQFPQSDNYIIGNNSSTKSIYIISQNTDYFSEDHTLRVYEYRIDLSSLTEIASIDFSESHIIRIPDTNRSNAVLFSCDNDNDERVLYLLNPTQKTVDPLVVGIQNSNIAVVGSYVYYNKEECVYRVCLDTMELLRIS